jgi:tRNA(adenine34) deaminase
VVFGAADERWGACGSVFHVLEPGRLNHDVALQGGVLAAESAALLRAFFRARRGAAGADPSP